MGPGGLRGLQILRSDASGARGGFDSHAFPPLLLLFLLVGTAAVTHSAAAGLESNLLAGTSSREREDARVPLPDSANALRSAAGKDTAQIRGSEQAPKPAAAAPDTAGLSRFEVPRWVMLRSLVVPGWGQLYNGSWFKALAVAGGEVGLVAALFRDRRVLDRMLADVDRARASHDDVTEQALVDDYNARLNGYVTHQWLLAGMVGYALLDAYIDAHFRGFKLEFKSDPALPRGSSPGSGKQVGVRVTF